jgi:non-ribosomal peptide synthase protein (TIGR01720 family)
VRETAQTFADAGRIYSISIGELLLINLVLVLERMTGCNNVVVETEGHGRSTAFSSDIDIDRTIGWFTRFSLRRFVIPQANLNGKIISIKEQLREPEWETPRFGVLRDMFKVLPAERFIRFNYLGDFDNVAENKFFSIDKAETGPDVSPVNHLDALAELNMYILSGELHLQITYNTGQTLGTHVADLLQQFKHQLKELSALFINNEGTKELTPSDFEMVSLSQSELDSLFD